MTRFCAGRPGAVSHDTRSQGHTIVIRMSQIQRTGPISSDWRERTACAPVVIAFFLSLVLFARCFAKIKKTQQSIVLRMFVIQLLFLYPMGYLYLFCFMVIFFCKIFVCGCDMPKLDWLQYTVKEVYFEGESFSCAESAFFSLPQFLQEDIVLNYSGCNSDIPFELIPGVNFYRSGLQFSNGVKVFFNPIRESMGYNVVISGSVLSRFLIAIDDIASWWGENDGYVSLSRVDIAYDCDIDFSRFFDKYVAGEYVTELRDIRSYVDSDNRGTLYFGKRSGRVMFRVYDKALETVSSAKGRKEKDRLRRELPVWTRVEGQFRHDAAVQALQYFLDCSIGSVFLGHLRFVDDIDVSNLSRDTVVWQPYVDLLGGCCMSKIVKLKNKQFNMYHFEKNVVPQVKAFMRMNPELYNMILASASESRTTVEKLTADDLLLSREIARRKGADFHTEIVQLSLIDNII